VIDTAVISVDEIDAEAAAQAGEEPGARPRLLRRRVIAGIVVLLIAAAIALFLIVRFLL